MIQTVVNMTINIIEEDGIEDFIPVLIDFDKRAVTGLSEIPEGVDHRAAVKNWLSGMQIENYGVAFRIGDEIGVMTSSSGEKSFARLTRSDGSWAASEAQDFFI